MIYKSTYKSNIHSQMDPLTLWLVIHYLIANYKKELKSFIHLRTMQFNLLSDQILYAAVNLCFLQIWLEMKPLLHHWSKHELEISVKNIQNKKKKTAQNLQKRLIFRYHKLKLVVNKCRNFLDFNLHSDLQSCYSNQIMILDWHFNTETQFY